MIKRYALPLALSMAAVLALPLASFANDYDTPEVSSIGAGKGKWVIDVTAGESGAPHGFTIWWMKKSTFDAVGQTWFPTGNQVQASAYFVGEPTLNTWGGQLTSFALAPNQTARIELGDLFDETGITQANALALKELEPGVEYVFCAWALGEGSVQASAWSYNVYGATVDNNCTYTRGFWQTHGPGACQLGNNSNEWPVNSLMLGNILYTDTQLCSILWTPAGGNGLISLASQLITAKLNVASGADPSVVAGTIAAADALIGNLVVPPVGTDYLHPSLTSSLTQALDDWNNGITGPGHCDATPVQPATWGQVKASYR
jgi:hypothetical protein